MLVALASKTAVLSTRDMAVATTNPTKSEVRRYCSNELPLFPLTKTSFRLLWQWTWIAMIWSDYTSLKKNHKVFHLPDTAFCSGACPCNVMHGSFMTLWSWLASGFHDTQSNCFQCTVHAIMQQKMKLPNFSRKTKSCRRNWHLKGIHSFVTLCGQHSVGPRSQLCTDASARCSGSGLCAWWFLLSKHHTLQTQRKRSECLKTIWWQMTKMVVATVIVWALCTWRIPYCWTLVAAPSGILCAGHATLDMWHETVTTFQTLDIT